MTARTQPRKPHAATPEAHRLFEEARQLHRAGRLNDAAAAYRAVIAHDPKLAQAHNNLGNVLTDAGALDDARAAYDAALVLKPDYAEARFNLANIFYNQSKLGEARAQFERALELRPNLAQAHVNLGNIFARERQFTEAVACFRRAVASDPTYAFAYSNLGNALKRLGRIDDAIAAYAQALELKPDNAEAHYNLGNALRRQGKLGQAIVAYERALGLKPDFSDAHYNLGAVLESVGHKAEALPHFERALALKPDNAEVHIALANLLLGMERTAEADRFYRSAHGLQQVMTFLSAKPKADFAVLVLNAPNGGNTPTRYLIGDGDHDFDVSFMMVMPGLSYDVDAVRAKADVVVNLISDVDCGREALPLARDLIERLARPTLNHPAKVLLTGREEVAARLGGIANCRVPKTIRIAGTTLRDDTAKVLVGFARPVLARVSGRHGGHDFEKCDDEAAVRAFAAAHPDAEHYVSEYIPYESADGHFRKYRLIFVNGEILPYHLAIGDAWKVHHFRTDMAQQAWMRDEEEAFVKAPRDVFGPAQWAALTAIRDAIGLDYFGIDCALDRDGNVVVFEVNATMLVHEATGEFAYKAPYVARIKTAFEAMLTKAAGRGI